MSGMSFGEVGRREEGEEVMINCKLECIKSNCNLGVSPKKCQTAKQVRKKIRSKLAKLNERTGKFDMPPAEIEDVESAFLNSVNGGFLCPCCERPFDLWASTKNGHLWGIARAASLDHLIPIRGGKSTNHRYNLRLICHECNTVKGMVDPIYWETTVTSIKKEHGISGFHKWLDEQYGIATSRELGSGWWKGKKEEIKVD